MKKIFIKTQQPLALEILGYVLCLMTGFITLKILGFQNWESYIWAVIVVFAIGATYRLCVAYTKEVVIFVEKFYEKITTFLCRLAGKRGEMSPKERTRYGVIGASLFIPAILSFFTFPYLLQKSMGCPIGISYLLTIPLAFIIFLVDRGFVATMGWKKIWYSIMARVVLAVALGLFLSKPIELRYFEKETTEELKVQKQAKLTSLEKERTAALEELRAQESTAMSELNRARAEYEKEINESIGGRRAGHGIEAKKKEAYYREQESLYHNNVAPKIKERRKEIETTFDQKKAEYISTQSDGLGARAQALDAAGKKYPAIAYNAWLILITLIMLDLSPLLVKLFMPKSESDAKEQTEEETAEHEAALKKIDRKYELMSKELNAAINMIGQMQISEDKQEKLITFERTKLQRKYFGEESVHLN
jgi:hypothetical protein